MSVSFAIAIYVVLWWTVLFAILPIGVRTQDEDGAVVPGTPGSAPTRPAFLRVILLTTLVSAVVFAAAWAAIRYGVSRPGATVGPQPRALIRTERRPQKRNEQGHQPCSRQAPLIFSPPRASTAARYGNCLPRLGLQRPCTSSGLDDHFL